MKVIIETNIEILNQLIGVLNQLNCDIYKKNLKVLNMSTLGQHFRHIIEFYKSFLAGIENNIVDYDARIRSQKLENNLEFGKVEIEEIITQLHNLKNDSAIILKVNVGNNRVTKVHSTISRELTYLLEHTIHHLAIIKIGLSDSFPDVFIPANVGIAFSTIEKQIEKVVTA